MFLFRHNSVIYHISFNFCSSIFVAYAWHVRIYASFYLFTHKTRVVLLMKPYKVAVCLRSCSVLRYHMHRFVVFLIPYLLLFCHKKQLCLCSIGENDNSHNFILYCCFLYFCSIAGMYEYLFPFYPLFYVSATWLKWTYLSVATLLNILTFRATSIASFGLICL
jgi:hypothetical protein